jgi:DNA-binding transcriptional ArsR family regulator
MPEGKWITAKDATDLNTALARFYTKVGERTPTRDLNDLTKMGLVEKDKRRYRVRRSVIQAFIPLTWGVQQSPSLEDLLADLPPVDEGLTLFDD